VIGNSILDVPAETWYRKHPVSTCICSSGSFNTGCRFLTPRKCDISLRYTSGNSLCDVSPGSTLPR
jgi:hypothetical protein